MQICDSNRIRETLGLWIVVFLNYFYVGLLSTVFLFRAIALFDQSICVQSLIRYILPKTDV